MIEEKIECLVEQYSTKLKEKIDFRLQEMKDDDNSHYFIYRVLGITEKEGRAIDEYQNKGRFLYKYAGSFLEEVTILCFEEKFKHAKRKVRIENKIGLRPKTFEIDCLVDNNAYEIKWRDATTDGDHITKEHTRVQNIKNYGYIPIRIMFYYPTRTQAIKIQETLKTVYQGVGGSYFFGDKAWNFVKSETNIDLLCILENIVNKKTNNR
ncbi:MAG: ApaLI family restriction endonuclease [Alphaproteobacteria bacterium]|nr:ApaLI family restriction endonuclease [Alphaproteobacteria bacterium]